MQDAYNEASPLPPSCVARARAFVRANDGLIQTLRIALRKVRRCGLADAARAVLGHLSPTPRGLARRYRRFIALYEPPRDAVALAEAVAAVRPAPAIALLLPATDDPAALRASVASLLAQALPHWTLGVVGAAHCRAALPAGDARIRFEAVAPETSPADRLQVAARLASGEFQAILWPGDTLPPLSLLAVAEAVQRVPEVEWLYTDEDRRDARGRRASPQFKPQWSPDTLLAYPYTGQLSLWRTARLAAAGGFRDGFGGALEYDLALRLAEGCRRIVRVPGVYYHRAAEGVGAPGDDPAACGRALAAAIARRGLDARVSWPSVPVPSAAPREAFAACPFIEHAVQGDPHVTIIIPTRNHGADVAACIASVRARTAGRRFDIMLVDNGSDEPASLRLFDELSAQPDVRVLRRDEPFNFSRLNNAAAGEAAGDYLLFLNNDTEVLADGWLDRLLAFAQQPQVGAVGARLFYPDGTIQHAGVARVGFGPTHVFGHLPADYPHPRCQRDGNWAAVTAACLLVAREKYQAAGGFDESLPVAFNDVDFCFRLLALGYHNVLAAGARLRHHEFRTRGNDRAQEAKRQRLLEALARLDARWPPYRDDPGYNPNLSTDWPDFAPRN